MSQPTQVQPLTTWAIVVFAARETADVLWQSVQAARRAGQGRAHIDVLVNGNPSLANELVACMERALPVLDAPIVNIWSIDAGDKANAWNQYIHCIWSGQSLAFFIDGYVRLNPDSVMLLGDALSARPTLLGGTGIPTTGRSAKSIRKSMTLHGGFHGNFCCVTGAVIEQIRYRRISLPFGLYRVDSLMGALLSFGLHPEKIEWYPRHIYVHPTATWQTDAKHWWRLKDLKDYIKRVLRQSRGTLENKAVTHHFVACKRTPELLPATAASLVLSWATACPAQIKALCKRRPLVKRALAQIQQPPPFLAAQVEAVLVFSTNSQNFEPKPDATPSIFKHT